MFGLYGGHNGQRTRRKTKYLTAVGRNQRPLHSRPGSNSSVPTYTLSVREIPITTTIAVATTEGRARVNSNDMIDTFGRHGPVTVPVLVVRGRQLVQFRLVPDEHVFGAGRPVVVRTPGGRRRR